MRLSGYVVKSEKYWLIEVPILDVATQGRSKKDAYFMIADAIECLVNRPDFKISAHPGKGEYFEISASDDSILTAFLLQRERQRSGLSLKEVAQRLGAKSINAYARYEQGRATPTIQKLSQLLAAVTSHGDFVIQESRT